MAKVTNISRTIEEVKAQNIWVAGLVTAPRRKCWVRPTLAALALVVGAESEGMSRLVRETCDFLVRIPMYGSVESLNAAVAGSIALRCVPGADNG